MRTTKLALFLGLIAVGCGSPEVRFGPALSSGDLFGVVLVTATVSGGEPDEVSPEVALTRFRGHLPSLSRHDEGVHEEVVHAGPRAPVVHASVQGRGGPESRCSR